ncbi:MAG: ribosomal RNA small subunit methyltransferase A [Clostridia bacterium]|nr:ribosomal RNA small subunit methyltransferase A [Clostridia bacterium]
MNGFKHSHSLGQNFLTDKNLLSAIVADAGVTASDTVVEVGAGQGALTRPLAETGARVIAFEIDTRLEEYLRPLEEKYPNLTVIFGDFMKSAPELISGRFKAVANLPYYITTPVLFRFLDDERCDSVTVMVQKEVAERIVASPGGKDYGVLSVSCNLAGKPKITRIVGRQMFTPPPNVDSAVVHIDVENPARSEKVSAVVKSAFAMRRKTLYNCLSSAGYDKAKITSALATLGLDPSVRGERLTPEQFVKLAEMITN